MCYLRCVRLQIITDGGQMKLLMPDILHVFYLFIFIFYLKDHERRTPLHAAACVGDVHIMDLLIESGDSAAFVPDNALYLL